jgi:hypothetical protein
VDADEFLDQVDRARHVGTERRHEHRETGGGRLDRETEAGEGRGDVGVGDQACRASAAT